MFVGFNSSFNELEQLIWLLAEMKEIQLFVIVFKHGDRFNPELARWLITKLTLNDFVPVQYHLIDKVKSFVYQNKQFLIALHNTQCFRSKGLLILFEKILECSWKIAGKHLEKCSCGCFPLVIQSSCFGKESKIENKPEKVGIMKIWTSFKHLFRFSEHLSQTLKNKLNIDFDLPIFYIDSHFNSRDENERRNFVIETHKLWSHMLTRSSWTSLTKSDIEAAMRLIRKKFGEIKEKYVFFQQSNLINTFYFIYKVLGFSWGEINIGRTWNWEWFDPKDSSGYDWRLKRTSW